MSIKTLIEWATDTVNFVWGCAKVSPACLHCYAVSIAMRFSKGKVTWGKGGNRWDKSESAIVELLKISRRAKRTGERPRVFINSMSDTFEDHEELHFPRINLFQCIETYPEIDFLLLTKRPENIMRMIPEAWRSSLPRNVWMGTTVENQDMADERIPHLLRVPAAVRFLSGEPLLGAINLDYSINYVAPNGKSVDWVICGCESGQSRRAMQTEWALSLANQCRMARIQFFMKQMEIEGKVTGEIEKFPAKLQVRQFPEVQS